MRPADQPLQFVHGVRVLIGIRRSIANGKCTEPGDRESRRRWQARHAAKSALAGVKDLSVASRAGFTVFSAACVALYLRKTDPQKQS